MKVKVTKESVIITELNPINAGEVGVNLCEFQLPEEFASLSVTASFNNIPVPVSGNECVIPALKKGTVVLGVYAYRENAEGVELMYSPKPTAFYVNEGSYSDEICSEDVPAISEYERFCNLFANHLIEKVKDAEKISNKTEELSEGSTNTQYPSAEAVYNFVAGTIGQDTHYKDITDTFTLKVGAYKTADGKYNSAQTTGQCTDLFPVVQGEKFKVTGFYTWNHGIIVLYDENKEYIKSLGYYELGEKNGAVGTIEYTIPEIEVKRNNYNQPILDEAGNPIEKKVSYIACATINTANAILSIEKEFTKLKNVQEEFEDVREEFGKEAENASQSSKVAIDIAQKGESVKEYTVQDGGLNESGTTNSNASRKRTGFIPVYGSDIKLVIPGGLKACIWEFDENKSFVEYDDWREGTYEYAVSNPYIRLTFKNNAGDNTITLAQVSETIISEYSPLLAADEPAPDPEPDTDADEEIVLSEAEIKACQDFAGLFVSATGRAETLLFFADPHLAHETDVYPKFDFMLDKIKAVYDSTPVSTCVCGGDWLLDGNTKESASWLLGKIDGAMKSRFGKYINVLGNHDTNYLGDAYKENLNQADHVKCILSNTTLANLWYRKYGKNYFSTDGDCTKFYVFDTGIDWDATMNDYRWEQVDWFANSLIEENPERCAILLHIGTKGYVATPMVDNLTKVAQAFNNKTTLTLNNATYDFTNSAGKVYFALSGHAHVDMALVQNDIPVVLTAQTCKYTDTTPTYDLVLADYGANKIRLVRVGEERSHEGTDDFDENGIRTFDMA